MDGRLLSLSSQNNVIKSEDLLLKHPFLMFIAGGSYSGKTHFTKRIIKHAAKMVDVKFSKILYCYGIFDPSLFNIKDENDVGGDFIEFHQGVPSIEYLKSSPTPLLLILDDLMKEAAKSGFLDMFFTKGAHHMDISVILIAQDIFYKDLKTARNNAHYIALMKNPSGERQVRDLASQLFPGKNRKYFLEAKESATRENWSHFFIDMHPGSKDILRLRTKIFPDETLTVFIPRIAY